VTRLALRTLMIAVVVGAAVSCGQRDNAELDTLRRQIEALEKKVGDIRPTATSFVYAQMTLCRKAGPARLARRQIPSS
jgi:hypothetical protein